MQDSSGYRRSVVGRHPSQLARAMLAAGCTVPLLALCRPVVGQPQEQAGADAYPVRVEGHVGWQDPFGTVGVTLAYDDGGRFSGGFGLGLDAIKKDTLPPLGVFGRARLLHWGWGTLGIGVALSREHDARTRVAGQSSAVWDWNPAYRATSSLGAELTHRGWSLRLDAGIGYLLNEPQCHGWDDAGSRFDGRCDSPPVPSDVHTASEHSRWIPSLTASIGHDFALPALRHSHAADMPPGYKYPDTALSLSFWSTLLPMLAGTLMILPTLTHSNDRLAVGGAALVGLGLAFGPSIGYAYADEQLRAWGMGGVRLTGGALGLALLISGLMVSEQTSKDDPGRQALGACLIGAVVVSAIYDIATVPNAARRTNSKRGVTNLGLAPMPIPGRSANTPGLVLVGRF
jgi:hypothetical protein